ncbi:PREDICTED: cuticle protein 64 [Vollenhovia emeryi]|uniref:cuticle protein 64 n=1 Tax=Vollenhovia emeryi TaxID=411798 RepID=UPI0005F57498|nr:PREDICTED: cuticle protein 64 [Vollenhovia emeryi]
MFKLAVLAAILAVACAAPGGLTGLTYSGHSLGPIAAPAVISHAPALSLGAHVVHQPIAPVVHSPPIVTKTVLTGHGLGLGLGHGLGLGVGHGLVGLHG